MIETRGKPVTVTLLLSLVIQNGYGATCSCAGVSLSDTVTQTGLPEDTWRFTAGYRFQDISDLVQGRRTIDDETGRQRETESYSLQLAYGLNNRWTLSASTSYVEHFRNISTSGGPGERSSGAGDTVLATVYTPVRITPYSRNGLSLGLAQKFATGEDGNRQNGILFIEDMQPGTGAASTMAWVYGARAFSPQAVHTVFTSLSYTTNETNDREYRFGDEVTAAFGYLYQEKLPWAFSISLSYRDADVHRRFGFDVPNTGGTWINVSPAVQYGFTEKLALRLAADLPVERKLDGALQFTTKYAASLAVTYQWR